MKLHPIRATLAIIAWGIVTYCLVAGTEIPGELWGIAGSITGFYFGTAQD